VCCGSSLAFCAACVIALKTVLALSLSWPAQTAASQVCHLPYTSRHRFHTINHSSLLPLISCVVNYLLAKLRQLHIFSVVCILHY